MEVKEIFIQGPLVIQPRVFFDPRGYFYESYNQDRFEEAGISARFVQDNQSLSQKGAVRGLHFQAPPFAQGKLVRVVRGAVYDVIVDIRKSSPTYGQHFGIELSEENFTMLWIPEGFAHGFSTLKDQTIFQYKCTAMYHKESEGGLLWNDPSLGIDWKVKEAILSEKDLILPELKNFISPF
ncbi:MAG: dTDP-4-dehydrorhamnose 3,5-epimerase [Bacteroidota bacterium]|nr:dTDP-4-dehydrorhamnose 3,5-epimerase [Bacteroidota bacterium]MDX5429693.1 dTDP-4-dehydrorhamnose 3,5-epimerase [Bacteroidota bacterium]MDX5468474.1 dTDP-4-dehydrorhamnose 3,5-epimerase [Bacteroidota bacterium]